MKTSCINKRIKAIKEISEKDLESIHADLQAREYNSFNQLVKLPLENEMSKWLAISYPVLSSDLEDLTYGVIRRVRNTIKKMEAPFTSLDLFALAKGYLKTECEASLPTALNIENNLGLTKADFKQAVAALANGNESLIERVYLVHFEKCVSIVVKQTGCSIDLAHESTMNALLEVRSDLIKGKIRYGNLQSYFTSRAINKYFKKERKKKIVALQLTDGLEFYDDKEQKDDLVEKEFFEIVKSAIQKLCSECQYILRQFYFEELKLIDVAEQMNKSHQAVRKQTSRCRDKLKNFIGEKFYKQFIRYFSK